MHLVKSTFDSSTRLIALLMQSNRNRFLPSGTTGSDIRFGVLIFCEFMPPMELGESPSEVNGDKSRSWDELCSVAAELDDCPEIGGITRTVGSFASPAASFANDKPSACWSLHTSR